MFTLNLRDPFGCRGVSCVKLPAAVAFPTDDRLLRRIEESRRALPRDNMKALRKHREPLDVVSTSVQRARGIEAQPASTVDHLRDRYALQAESRSIVPLVRIEELHLRSRVAVGRR